MTTAARTTLESAYASLISRQRLQHNPHQARLIARLAQLQITLLATNKTSSILGSRSPTSQSVRGLYIYGSVGTGKSRLADLFAETLPPGISKRRVHFHKFMSDVHHRLHRARSQRNTDHSDPLMGIGKAISRESRVLCFDEFQVTDIADAMILGRLFGSIWNEGGVMVSTSNRHPNDLYERGLNRDVVLPFLREMQTRNEVWQIGGDEDYRMRSSRAGSEHERIETFFTNGEAFDARLKAELGTSKLEPHALPVFGTRTLTVLASPSLASTEERTPAKPLQLIAGSFSSLCKANLASQDYHAICSSTNTLFISDLVAFRAVDKDSARRLIILIDLAYEKGTRIFCHSAVPLDQLFLDLVPRDVKQEGRQINVKGSGGSSSSMMSTFVGETEWSATGLMQASLAAGGAGEADVGFAVGRALSRLYEMGWAGYAIKDT